MPYIDEKERLELDSAIENMTQSIRDIKCHLSNPHDFSVYLGRINYCFSRVIAGLMQDVSYKKIAMITGVLENIKQEFYRRVAENYENNKIAQNGDIKEYKNVS
ncbi:MAG: hypothetical protein EBV07_01625 [Proteobacteria bacterium]|nr:hypothetical protein [Pseudomonadota bacterium]